jgi:hypothetical protein
VWDEEVLGRDISPIHLEDLANTTIEVLTSSWLSGLPNRTVEIIALRFGLNGMPLTLNDIGENMNLSRERIRQIEKQTIRKLQQKYKSQNRKQLRPFLAFLQHSFIKHGGILTEEELNDLLQNATFIRLGQINPLGVFRLICEVDEQFRFYKREQIITLSSYPIEAINAVCQSYTEIMSQKLTNMCSADLINELKQTSTYAELQTVFSEQFFTACLRVHPDIEQVGTDLYALAKSSKRRMAAIVTAMRQIGEPTHYSMITEKVNVLLPPDEQFTERTIHAKLGQHPDIFVWTRLRGTYGLKEWGLEQGLSYVDAIEQIFLVEGKPLTFEQVIERIPTYREHFDQASVIITLGTHQKFRSLANNRYGLSSWNNKGLGLDFGDMFGEQLVQRQIELDRHNNIDFDTQTEVEKIRRVGLDFLSS